MGCKVIKVTNIPMQITKDILYTMFECIGKIEDIQLYPVMRAMSHLYDSRICFIKYRHSSCAETAHFLNNTPLMDRAIQVTPFTVGKRGKIPSEEKALELLVAEKSMDFVSVSWIEGIAPMAFYKTIYKPLEDLPAYPDLPAHYSSSTVEQIRRTLVVANLDHSFSGETLVDYFSKAGEVKYVRFCERSDDPGCYALVEFVNQESIIPALKLNNSEITEGIKIKVYHSVHAIRKYSSEDNNNCSTNEKSSAVFLDGHVCATDAENKLLQQSQPSSCAQSKSHRHSSSRSHDRKRSRSQQRRRSPCRKGSSSRERHQSGSQRSDRTRSYEHNKSGMRVRSRSRSRKCSSSRSRRSSHRSSRSRHQSKSSSHSKRRSMS